MANLKTCALLSDAFGPSGFENEVSDIICATLAGFDTRTDSMQNTYAFLPEQNTDMPLVMLDAHTDEVGFMVQSITDKGLLRIVPLGGWVEHNIPAHIFWVRNKNGELIKAVSSSKPPHFMTDAQRKAAITLDDIFLDVGVCCRNDAIELLNIEPGAPVCPDVSFEYNDSTDVMLGKAFDCRLGCAAAIEIFERLANRPLNVRVAASFSSQEEVGLRGAKVAAARLCPSLAICLEGTPADDMFTAECEIQGGLKRGVQLRYRDGTMVSSPAFVAFARKIAEENGINLQCAVRTGGGTNAGNIHLAANGVPTLVLGIPVRYAHTHYGYAAQSDFDAAVDLATAIIKALTPDVLCTLLGDEI
ncbi:MAG: M20/M25/M40 family metallo-hydrolase [Oscillospiraceae bacterium]